MFRKIELALRMELSALHTLTTRFDYIWIRVLGLMLTFSIIGSAQALRELPVERPKERTTNETVKVKTTVRQPPSTGLLIVLLNPIVPGKVIVKNSTGRVIKQSEADQEGQAEFVLPRGGAYLVEANSPGYSSGAAISRPLGAQTIVRVQLNAQSRMLRLPNLPTGSQVFFDNKLAEMTTVSGITMIANVAPSKHKLMVKHPEYSNFEADIDLSKLGIGESSTLIVTLERVAKLTIQSAPGANVMIDGVIQGRIPESGSLDIDYPLSQASTNSITSITAELTGYQSMTVNERLAPGARTINLPLERIPEAVGASDGFDNLNLWESPQTWKILTETNNRKLQVSGTKLGLLKDKIYKDFQAIFTIWVPNGKGATWAIRADQTGQNYYLFHLSGPKSTTHTPNRFYTYVVKNGDKPIEVNAPTPLVDTIDPNASYTIQVVARGYTIEHSITSNNTGERVTLGKYTDSSQTKDKFLYGYFGFRVLGDEVFSVDDFTIDPGKEASLSARPR